MDFTMGSGGEGASDDELWQEASDSRKGKRPFRRHTSQQIQALEAFFKQCAHPDENQRRKLSKELGLTTMQIKFWFQNKRTQTKSQNERADNSALRAENERIQSENLSIKEALKKAICQSCGGPPFGEAQRQRCLETLQLENVHLKEEHEKMSNVLAKYIGKPISQIDSLMPPLHLQGSPPDLLPAGLANGRIRGTSPASFDLGLNDAVGISSAENIPLPYRYQFFREFSNMEKVLMSETAATAMAEVIRLLRINEPLWIKSSDNGRYVLQGDNYEKIFPGGSYFKRPSARIESSKDSGIVTMNAINLVDMLLDPNKWRDLFPTIVTKARLIQVIETGLLLNTSDHLQLMYGEMHIISPLVPSREFCFLRHSQQIELGVWVIADVSYDSLKEEPPSYNSWRLPSGCMIQEMPDGYCKVTWVEHVEVDDKTQTHRLYRDLVCSGSAYGAERWIATLQRMCERLTFFSKITAPVQEPEGAIMLAEEGKRCIMKLAHRMVKNFCAVLSMPEKMDFPQSSDVNNSGVGVCIRNSAEPGQPCGVIVSAATSLWLPLHPQAVFSFFNDEKTRVQWDVLCSGNLMQEVAHISVGTHPGNYISIFRPFVPTENILILQESCIDPFGSTIVYAPLDVSAMNIAMSGEDSSGIVILPSGFTISTDGRSELTSGASASTDAEVSGASLLTIVFQILVASPSSSSCSSSSTRPASKKLNMEAVTTVNTLISSTVQKIKAAMGYSYVD